MDEAVKTAIRKIRSCCKTFLVTAMPQENQSSFWIDHHYTMLSPEMRALYQSSRYPDNITRIPRDNKYIVQIITEELGLQNIFFDNIYPNISHFMEQVEIDGLIIPVGHGDINCLSNLGFESPEDAGFPVFEAHKHYPGYRGYAGPLSYREIEALDEIARKMKVSDAFREWIQEKFKKR